MQGSSAMNPMDLEIGDEVKIFGDDSSFTCVLMEASQDIGLTFGYANGNQEVIISFMDLQDYNFYPRGKTIARINALKPADDLENPELIALTLVESLEYFYRGDALKIITKSKTYTGVVELVETKDGEFSSLDLVLTAKHGKGTVFVFSKSLLLVAKIYAIGHTAVDIAERIGDYSTPTEITQDVKDFFVLYEQYEENPLVRPKKAATIRKKMKICAGTNKDLLAAFEHVTMARIKKIEEYIKEISVETTR